MNNINIKLGDLLKSLSRLFYSHSIGVCWNCGSRCGMSSTMARGLLWCNDCFRKWNTAILDKDLEFNWKSFGKIIR